MIKMGGTLSIDLLSLEVLLMLNPDIVCPSQNRLMHPIVIAAMCHSLGITHIVKGKMKFDAS